MISLKFQQVRCAFLAQGDRVDSFCPRGKSQTNKYHKNGEGAFQRGHALFILSVMHSSGFFLQLQRDLSAIRTIKHI